MSDDHRPDCWPDWFAGLARELEARRDPIRDRLPLVVVPGAVHRQDELVEIPIYPAFDGDIYNARR